MKRSSFLALFIAANVGFILLHLHKQSQIIKHSYEKQKMEAEIAALAKQKQELTHQLYTLYDRARILNYAKNELNMSQAKVGQFKKINAIAQVQAIDPHSMPEIETLSQENVLLSQNDTSTLLHQQALPDCASSEPLVFSEVEGSAERETIV